MNGQWDRYKQAVICILIVAVSLMHFVPLSGWTGTHWLHRELYFFPILLAGFWFGTKGGLTASLAVSVVYVCRFAISGLLADVAEAIIFQVAVFIAVGLFLGWMVDRQERRRKELDFVNDVFGRYVSREVRDRILKGRIPLDGELKQATVLFADLREFTELLERQEPRTVVRILNLYFKEMTVAIRNHGGLVLQFVGDEIEAIFGAPISTPDHAQMAVDAAIEMRIRMEKINAHLKPEGHSPLRHGIGIHSGPVLAGNIGSPDRLSYAMVGSTVNLASRIQGVNKIMDTDILVSKHTKTRLGIQYNLVKLEPVRVKGFSEPVQLFSLGTPPLADSDPIESPLVLHSKLTVGC